MNSNNSNISTNTCYNTSNANTSKYRIKRPFGVLQNSYPEFYTPNSKKFKHSPNHSDGNTNTSAFNPDSKKNAAVFSSFSNDVDMPSQYPNHNTSASTEIQVQDIKKNYYDKVKQEMSNYKSQTSNSSSRMKVNYDCCNN